MSITQHTHIYSFHTSLFNFGVFFLKLFINTAPNSRMFLQGKKHHVAVTRNNGWHDWPLSKSKNLTEEGLSPLDKVRAGGQPDASNRRQSNRAFVSLQCGVPKFDPECGEVEAMWYCKHHEEDAARAFAKIWLQRQMVEARGRYWTAMVSAWGDW